MINNVSGTSTKSLSLLYGLVHVALVGLVHPPHTAHPASSLFCEAEDTLILCLGRGSSRDSLPVGIRLPLLSSSTSLSSATCALFLLLSSLAFAFSSFSLAFSSFFCLKISSLVRTGWTMGAFFFFPLELGRMLASPVTPKRPVIVCDQNAPCEGDDATSITSSQVLRFVGLAFETEAAVIVSASTSRFQLHQTTVPELLPMLDPPL